ncbi:MAG: hypothetical protein HY784_10855, partial [Chloroflexi bacterium]|nr:hypothetical protein [Chloroflexota bacterium]
MSGTPSSPGLSMLSTAARLVASAPSLTTFLNAIVRSLHAEHGFSLAAIYLDDPEEQALTLCAVAAPQECPASAYRLRWPGGPSLPAEESGEFIRCAARETLPILHPGAVHRAVPPITPTTGERTADRNLLGV